MYKYNLFFLLFILSCGLLRAQNNKDAQRDYTWALGYGMANIINFHVSPPTVSQATNVLPMLDMSSFINDTIGNLLFYTNGFKVMNKNHILMDNGDSLNCCFGYFQNGMFSGFGALQGVIILPKPNSDNLYYILHANADITSAAPYFQYTSNVYYSLVDMSFNGGLGRVVQKNIPLITDTLNAGMLNACRHANGRDWWMLLREYASNRYHRFLISSNGIQNIGIQTVGSSIPQYSYGQTIFSPDGSKFASAQIDQYNSQFLHYSVYAFDRCTGLLSNHITDTLPNYGGFAGIAFSPNSRYMYISSTVKVNQYDMQTNDWQTTQQTVADWSAWQDSAQNGYCFGFMNLGPDGKIYVYGGNSSYYLNVIHSPDSAGTACNFTHHSFPITTHNGRSMPNFPHFRLGALIGSGCDTLQHVGISEGENRQDVSIFPNPSKEKIYLQAANLPNHAHISLCNILGQELHSDTWQNTQIDKELNITDLPQGVYYLRILAGERVFTYKVIKE